MSNKNSNLLQKKPVVNGIDPFEILNILRAAGHETANPTIQTEVEYSPEVMKIIIPEGMTKKQAADDLMNQWKNEEQEQNFFQEFKEWDWKDVLYAARNVMEDHFGWIKGRPTWRQDPTEIEIVTDVKNRITTTEKIFYGPFSVPAWEDAEANMFVNWVEGFAGFSVKCKRKYGPQISELGNLIRQYLKNNSIYRGKHVIVSSEMNVESGKRLIEFNISEVIPNDKIFLNRGAELTVKEFILNSLGDKGKKTYLFTGVYGNGKTETAMNIGAQGLSLGMTFFYVKEVAQFAKLLSLAKNYEPCMIFLEDIDQIASGEKRDIEMNNLLNTIDGVETKGRDVTIILTTNHEKRISPALRRPGRIDLIVNFENPTKDTQQKIYDAHLSRFDGFDEVDWTIVMAASPEAQGAVIAEVCKRAAKLATRTNVITTEILLAAIESMKYHLQFMNDDIEDDDEMKSAFEAVRDFMFSEREFK